jgi:hypothetical protein
MEVEPCDHFQEFAVLAVSVNIHSRKAELKYEDLRIHTF